MKTASIILMAALAGILSGETTAETPDSYDGHHRFELYNDCKPIGLAVGKVFDDLQSLGISRENVQAAAESRLRASRLYADSVPAFLHVAASRYAIQLQYRKPLRDMASGETRSLRTFSKSGTVLNGTAAGVMLEVSNLLDLFLLDYLRVNESACGQAAPPRPEPRADPETPSGPKAGTSAEPRLFTHEDQPPPRLPRRPAAEPGGEPPKVFRIGSGVTSPRLLYKVAPEYSEKARKAKYQGTVMLTVEVWEDGVAHNIRILRSLGLGLDEKAVEAVRQWKFAPGRKDGKPVRVAAQIQVSFRILDGPQNDQASPPKRKAPASAPRTGGIQWGSHLPVPGNGTEDDQVTAPIPIRKVNPVYTAGTPARRAAAALTFLQTGHSGRWLPGASRRGTDQAPSRNLGLTSRLSNEVRGPIRDPSGGSACGRNLPVVGLRVRCRPSKVVPMPEQETAGQLATDGSRARRPGCRAPRGRACCRDLLMAGGRVERRGMYPD